MDARDIARVLAKAAAFDQRTVGDGDILAWLEAIGDLDLADALAAVTRHYRESTDFLRPAHLRRAVAAILADRERVERERDAAARRSTAPALPAGPTRDRSADVRALITDLRDRLPSGDPAKLRGPAWRERTRAGLRAVPPPAEPSTPITSEPAEEPEDPTDDQENPHAAPAA